VLKDGRTQGTLAIKQTNPSELIARMVGRGLALHTRHVGAAMRHGDVVLDVEDLTDPSSTASQGLPLSGVRFWVRRGEILAIAGLAGAGRTEAALAIFGMRSKTKARIRIEGKDVRIGSPAEAIAAGIGYLPEDRKEAGLFLEMSVAHNVAAANLKRFGRFWLQDSRINEQVIRYCNDLRIAFRHIRQPVLGLSGGNQQKVMLAKWLMVEPKVLIVDEPTRGVDVGAKSEVHRLLFELAERQTAIVVISSDLPEVLSVSDRILVMAEGRVVGELASDQATEEKIVHLASPSV
jgi:ABC-type sugar transport system ATPase subunit